MHSEMKSLVGVFLLLTFAGISVGYPTTAEKDPELGDKFQGDLLLSTEHRVDVQLGGRNGLIAENYRWPERKVFYKFFDGQMDAAHKNHVLRGMQLLEEVSCIRFYEANATTRAYINITALPEGCYSHVGHLNMVQSLNLEIYKLDTGCFTLATIVHEFLHSLGFYHQHSASDRDQFIKIVYENIEEGRENAFNVYSSSVVDDFGIPYDYGSVMHYHSTAFSKNGKPTIIPLDPTAQIGQRITMSDKDINKLNLMYKCPIPPKYARNRT